VPLMTLVPLTVVLPAPVKVRLLYSARPRMRHFLGSWNMF
jgi:hypothetical protein